MTKWRIFLTPTLSLITFHVFLIVLIYFLFQLFNVNLSLEKQDILAQIHILQHGQLLQIQKKQQIQINYKRIKNEHNKKKLSQNRL